jgi:hypothetical protein
VDLSLPQIATIRQAIDATIDSYVVAPDAVASLVAVRV